LLERRPRTLKHNDTFGLFDHNGDIVGGQGSPEGIFHEDTRHVSELRLTLNGEPPILLGSAVNDDNSVLSVDLTNPDLLREGKIEQPCNTVHVSRTRFLWDHTCLERLSVRNFDDVPRQVGIDIDFACDFADIFEVRGKRRSQRGKLAIDFDGPDKIVFTYEGLDARLRRTTLSFDPAPIALDDNHARFQITLSPRRRTSLFTAIHFGPAGDATAPRRAFFRGWRGARKTLRQSEARAASVTTSNPVFNELLHRARADLATLTAETEFGPYPYAGIPWFSTPFGRDGVITAIQMLWIDPAIARGVLGFLAATQATVEQPEADAQPGKILHEVRKGEMAELGEVPFKRYYGSVDSTPLFVVLAGMYLERTGDLHTIRQLWPNLAAALNWIDRYGDIDGDGFVEYQGGTGERLVNQGWKDSADSIFHADGRLAKGPIALCEVQSYVWAAKTLGATMAQALGLNEHAMALVQQAETLRARFEAAFWCEEISTYALALDGDKRPCVVRSSNAGQVLFGGIAEPARALRVANLMLDPVFYSGWGIRTVARSEVRYNPMSYHNGSVWPHDNAIIAAGLRRYGFIDHLERLFGGIFDAASYTELRRLPELFCGFRRISGRGPTFYPVACAPQAWASATPFGLLQSCLGIEFDPAGATLRFRRPCLPRFLDEVVIRRLTLPKGRIDVALRRGPRDVSVDVLRCDGTADIAVLR
jgi:glycogen debranching enzyme